MPTNDSPARPIQEATWQKSWIRDYFESICIAVIFALFVRTFVVQAFKIPSSSMEDNLLVGDHLLVNKFSFGPRPPLFGSLLPYREIRHQDVFVFKYPKDPNRDFIKRVIGVGGDSIEVQRGRVIRNGEMLEEPYVFVKAPPGAAAGGFLELNWKMQRDHLGRLQLRPGEYFAMGDNRLNSDDSRFWGTVPEANVKGKAVAIYWSFDVPEHCKVVELDGGATPAMRLQCLGYTMLHFFDRSRWRRTGRLIR